jgi:hypothetical protein
MSELAGNVSEFWFLNEKALSDFTACLLFIRTSELVSLRFAGDGIPPIRLFSPSMLTKTRHR